MIICEIYDIIKKIKKRGKAMKDENILVLNDEDGNELKFEILDVIDYENEEYVVLFQLGCSGDDVIILKIGESEIYDDDECTYSGIEDEEVLQAVFKLYLQRNN